MKISRHKRHYKLPSFIRWLFYSCDDCGVKLRNAKSGKGFGTPHFVYNSIAVGRGTKKITRYVCLPCEMNYDNE